MEIPKIQCPDCKLLYPITERHSHDRLSKLKAIMEITKAPKKKEAIKTLDDFFSKVKV